QGGAPGRPEVAAGPRPPAHGLHRPGPGRLPHHQRAGPPGLTRLGTALAGTRGNCAASTAGPLHYRCPARLLSSQTHVRTLAAVALGSRLSGAADPTASNPAIK